MKSRKNPPKRWAQFTKVIKKLREGGWFYPKDLEKELKLPKSTIKHDLKLGVYIGIFKQERKRGPYAWIDYESEEEIIRKVINHHFPYGIRVAEVSKYRTTEDSIEETVRDAAIQAGRDPNDQSFRKIFFKVFRKCRNSESF